jgi:hypothetical protein
VSIAEGSVSGPPSYNKEAGPPINGLYLTMKSFVTHPFSSSRNTHLRQGRILKFSEANIPDSRLKRSEWDAVA